MAWWLIFGYPGAHEDDAERAVRAGLQLAGAVCRCRTGDGTPLTARVGIATGLVMVGDLISESVVQECATVGETPNPAARLQAVAGAGEVVIGPGTRRLVGGLFELARLGAQHLKGFANPVPAWRVVGEAPIERCFEALRGTRLTPLVGREREVGVLLERWAWAKDGEGQVVLIAGEPGIGKSWIVRALRERLEAEPCTPLSHYGSPYHQNTALYPLFGLLERAAASFPMTRLSAGSTSSKPCWRARPLMCVKRRRFSERCSLSSSRSAIRQSTSARNV